MIAKFRLRLFIAMAWLGLVAALVFLAALLADAARADTGKLYPVVEACGIYKTHNRVCLEWTDQRWHASRDACMKRAQEIVGSVKTLTRYAGVKLERHPVPKCVEK